jgi:hypothetical protein
MRTPPSERPPLLFLGTKLSRLGRALHRKITVTIKKVCTAPYCRGKGVIRRMLFGGEKYVETGRKCGKFGRKRKNTKLKMKGYNIGGHNPGGEESIPFLRGTGVNMIF